MNNVVWMQIHYIRIGDTLGIFHERGITKKQLIRWIKSMNAIYPWSDGYDVFRQIVNRRFTFFPAIIAMTTNLSQVETAMKTAIKYNLPFCIRGGAHAYEPFSTINIGGILIDQNLRTRISINHKNNQVTIEPGVLNGPLADKLGTHNLAIPRSCWIMSGRGYGVSGEKIWINL